jgi:Ca-activated chloride channel homolog
MMRRLTFAGAIGVAIAVTVSSPLRGQQPPQQPAQQTQQPAPTFRTGIDLVSLNITVTEGASARYVTDLNAQDFQIYEDGVQQEITVFNRSNLPIALSLLMDTSASMEGRLPIAQEAAVGFARKLRPQDLGELIDFDSRVVILQPFTNKAADLEQAIRRTSAGGSTSMYNAIYIALKDLKKVVAASVEDIRRQAIVVLSDGEDTSSLLPFEEVLDLAKRSETAIYTIGLRASDVSARGFKEAEFVLRQLSQETGGRSFFPTAAAELPAIYGQIADELSSQYTVGYTSKNLRRDGAWRRIVVRIARQGAAPRTKQGYFGPSR